MSKHPRQSTLLDIFSKRKRLKPAYEEDGDESSSGETEEQDNESDSSGSESTDVTPSSNTGPESSCSPEIPCDGSCCSDSSVPFQPNSTLLKNMSKSGRNFVPNWFKEYPWLTACISKGKVYCIYCKSAAKNGL